MTYSPDESVGGEVAVVNLVGNSFIPELGITLDEPSARGQLIINLRAEADPALLAAAVAQAIAETTSGHPGLQLNTGHTEHFRPGRPEPTPRDR